MARLEHVPVGALDPHRFGPVLDEEQFLALLSLIERGNRQLEGRVIWNVNSTARGGGVAELLRPLLSYARGAGVDARWVVIRCEPEFFATTKRLHNHLHGFGGAGGPLTDREHEIYERGLAECAAELVPLIRPCDVVILHDPQTAGLVEAVKQTGAVVIWRCHVGRDRRNRSAREAWRFLKPHVSGADAFVFSRREFIWEGLPEERVAIIQPSIDVFSPKNQDQSPERTLAILSRAGIIRDGEGDAAFTRVDGSPGRVDRRATMIEDTPLSHDVPLVAQVSRWDRLKDPIGVLRGFTQHIAGAGDAHLLLAGPATDAVSDDPEAAGVLAAARHAWEHLPAAGRSRVHLASLPMDDVEENAAVVNAIQRHSTVLVQKSLAEGFGLVVAEGMWKGRPVVASRVGGIQDQIIDGESGLLIAHPRDLEEFGTAVVRLLRDPEEAERIGAAARLRVRERFLGPRHLDRYFELIEQLLAQRRGVAVSVTQSLS